LDTFVLPYLRKLIDTKVLHRVPAPGAVPEARPLA
jgi:hypothetical protein